MTLEAFIDSLGLRYFKGREFTPYWSKVWNGVRNSEPPKELWPNIVKTLVVLDEIRHQLGAPIALTSTYRSPDYNRAVGGEKKSFHMQFKAIDFQASKGKPSQWAKIARGLRGRKFTTKDGTFTFRGGVGLYKTFVHIDNRGTDADW